MHAIDTLEERIYEAAIVPDLWPQVLEELSVISGGVGGVLFSVTQTGSHWTASPGIYEAMTRFVNEGWYRLNSRQTIGFAKGLANEPRFVSEADMFEGDAYLTDPIYTDFFYPNGLGFHAGTVVSLPQGDSIILSVERSFAQGMMEPDAVERLTGLRPHLARSAMMAARLSFERARTAVETLSLLGLPAAALSDGGRVRIANGLFHDEKHLWTTRGEDRLALFDQRAARLFEAALQSASLTRGGQSLALQSRDGEARAVLHLVPVRLSARDLFGGAAALAVMTKVEGPQVAPTALLKALFDLTAAESSLAADLATGLSLDDIAARTGKGIETLRSHLKRVREKTGCRRQAELVSLLVRLVPPYLAPDTEARTAT